MGSPRAPSAFPPTPLVFRGAKDAGDCGPAGGATPPSRETPWTLTAAEKGPREKCWPPFLLLRPQQRGHRPGQGPALPSPTGHSWANPSPLRDSISPSVHLLLPWFAYLKAPGLRLIVRDPAAPGPSAPSPGSEAPRPGTEPVGRREPVQPGLGWPAGGRDLWPKDGTEGQGGPQKRLGLGSRERMRRQRWGRAHVHLERSPARQRRRISGQFLNRRGPGRGEGVAATEPSHRPRHQSGRLALPPRALVSRPADCKPAVRPRASPGQDTWSRSTSRDPVRRLCS